MYTYLLINLSIIAIPLILSFDHRVSYYKKWPALALAAAIVGLYFIGWDALATEHSHWGFSAEHITGIHLFGLPIEEVLFFITVPYSCIFIYECLSFFLKDSRIRVSKGAITTLAAISLLLAMLYSSQTYTLIVLVTFSFTLLLLRFAYPRLLESKIYWGYIFLTLVAFLIFNYLLTSIPVVTYGVGTFSGLRVATIPLEDFFYNFSMLSLDLMAYLWAKEKLGIK